MYLNILKFTLLGGLNLFINGCVYYPSDAATKIIETSEREVANCKLLGQVYGDSAYLLFTSVGVQVAKDQAKEKAASLGATHVYWLEQNLRVKPYVVARAYRCSFK